MTELTVQQQFEDKIKDKLRKDMGDLMPDEVLSKLVEKATNDIFFNRERERDTYGREHGREESWFDKEVKEKLQKSVNEAVQKIVKEQEEEIKKVITKAFTDDMPKMVSSLLIGILQNQGYQLSNLVQQYISNLNLPQHRY